MWCIKTIGVPSDTLTVKVSVAWSKHKSITLEDYDTGECITVSPSEVKGYKPLGLVTEFNEIGYKLFPVHAGIEDGIMLPYSKKDYDLYSGVVDMRFNDDTNYGVPLYNFSVPMDDFFSVWMSGGQLVTLRSVLFDVLTALGDIGIRTLMEEHTVTFRVFNYNRETHFSYTATVDEKTATYLQRHWLMYVRPKQGRNSYGVR